jgi:hypothetical protein
MTREVQPPTTNERGDEVHPAFGMIGASRGSSTPGQVLFDSDIRHGNTVRITISRASRRRDLHRDWLFGNDEFVEVELSEAQWASFVSSMNVGSGVPCTIRRTENEARVPELPYDPRLAHSMDEVKGKAAETFAKIKKAMEEYDALDPKAPAKDRRAALGKIRNSVEHAEGNLAFATQSLTEHAENVVQRARADIEAMVVDKAAQLGLTAGQSAGLLELPSMPGEEVRHVVYGVQADGTAICACGSEMPEADIDQHVTGGNR